MQALVNQQHIRNTNTHMRAHKRIPQALTPPQQISYENESIPVGYMSLVQVDILKSLINGYLI